MGGTLSHPYETFPRLFNGDFWHQYPYFLPCFASACFSAFSFIIALVFLKEVRLCGTYPCGGAKYLGRLFASGPNITSNPQLKPRLRPLPTSAILLGVTSQAAYRLRSHPPTNVKPHIRAGGPS
jgi:hypothetical protein